MDHHYASCHSNWCLIPAFGKLDHRKSLKLLCVCFTSFMKKYFSVLGTCLCSWLCNFISFLIKKHIPLNSSLPWWLCFMGQFQPLPIASVLTDILPCLDSVKKVMALPLGWDTAVRISHMGEQLPPAVLQPQDLENIALCCYYNKAPRDFC